MAFEKINISQSLKSALSSVICSGHFPHASILEDEDLERAMLTAKEIAQALVCTGDNKPCRKCNACLKAQTASHPDIKVFGYDMSDKTFKVDLAREIRADAYIVPNEADKKIYILYTDSNMNPAAQNALLKVLEEPPENVLFIIITPERNSFLQTILSRCVVFSQIGTREITQQVRECACSLAQALTQPNEYELMSVTARFEKDKDLLKESLTEAKEVFRAGMLFKAGSSCSSKYPDEARLLSSSFTLQALLKLIECCDEMLYSMERNENYNLLLTRLCSELRRASGR